MAIDPKIAEILRIAPRKTGQSRTSIKPTSPPSQETINAGYQSLGFPVVSRSGNELVQAFHTRAIGIIQEEARTSTNALSRVDKDLRSEVRTARMAGIARMSSLAIQRRLQDAAKPLATVILNARNLVDSVMNRQPEDPAKAMLWLMKVAETRRQIEGMKGQDAIQAAVTLANRGDEVFPEVFLNGLKPIIPMELASRLTVEYQKALVAPAVAALEEAGDALEEVHAIIGCTEIALGNSLTKSGSLPADWRDVPVSNIVKAWPQDAKASFVAAKGEDAFTELLRGTVDLEMALDVFRPGLALAEEI